MTEDEEPFELWDEFDDWYCFHHEHLATQWTCSYMENPDTTAENRKPTRVTVRQVITRWEPDYGDAT